jgi:VWFA-related protein
MRAPAVFALTAFIVGGPAAADVPAPWWSRIQEQPRFRGGVELVRLDVTVLDKQRRLVTGLLATDFEVLVDGKPQPLAGFTAVTLPDAPPGARWTQDVVSDVTTNHLASEGRLVVIIMDRSTPNGQPLAAARATALAAIDQLGPTDLAAVVFTAAASRKYSQGLTNDRSRLRAAVNHAVMGMTDEPPEPGRDAQKMALASEEQSGECLCGVCVLESLTAVAENLGIPTGRQKSMLFVGSDIAMSARNPESTCASRIQRARERLMGVLDAGNITFHALDPRGLEGLGAAATDAHPTGNDPFVDNVFRQQSLSVLPDYTGGRTVLNTNDPAGAVGPLFTENRSYYVLAIARDTSQPHAGARRQIKVLVHRDNVTVRARDGYSAPEAAAKTTPATRVLESALGGLLPVADIPLQMHLAARLSPDGTADVGVLLGSKALTGTLDVLIVVFDGLGHTISSTRQVITVPSTALAASGGFQWQSALKLAPGAYEVRAAVAVQNGARSGSVTGYVVVPNVRKDPLVLSDILVKDAASPGPTLRRVFDPGDELDISFEVARKTPGSVSVEYVVVDDEDRIVAQGTLASEDASFSRAGVAQYHIPIALPTASGRYLLRVDATDGRHPVRRAVRLTVRERSSVH